LIGAGRIGLVHAAAIMRHVPAFKLVAAADTELGALEKLRIEAGDVKFLEAADLINDAEIDAVLVCSPTGTHSQWAVQAAEAGKHIFCEKPLADTEAAAEACIAAADVNRVVLQVGLNRRFDPNFTEVRRQVKDGLLGTLLTLKITSRDPQAPPAGYPRHPGGLYIDSAIHDFDMARYLMCEEVAEVSSFGSALTDPLAARAGDIDTAVTILRFESGALAALDNARISAIGYDQRVEVHGTRSTVLVENIRDLSTVVADEAGEHRGQIAHFFHERYAHAYIRQMQAFAGAIAGGEVLATGWDALMAQRLASLAHRSLVEHRAIQVAGTTAKTQQSGVSG
jgi:myo-inositol 2-dehydrogenase/D-chiro-inositol 1-dehydrogenase